MVTNFPPTQPISFVVKANLREVLWSMGKVRMNWLTLAAWSSVGLAVLGPLVAFVVLLVSERQVGGDIGGVVGAFRAFYVLAVLSGLGLALGLVSLVGLGVNMRSVVGLLGNLAWIMCLVALRVICA